MFVSEITSHPWSGNNTARANTAYTAILIMSTAKGNGKSPPVVPIGPLPRRSTERRIYIPSQTIAPNAIS